MLDSCKNINWGNNVCVESNLACQGELFMPLDYFVNYKKTVPNNTPIDGFGRKCFRNFDEAYFSNNDKRDFLIRLAVSSLGRESYTIEQQARAYRLLKFRFWSQQNKCSDNNSQSNI